MGKAKTVNFCSATRDLVLSAISTLTLKTCWSARTIVKFIKMEYNISDPGLSRRITSALKAAVEMGLLEIDDNRYRLSNITQCERCFIEKHKYPTTPKIHPVKFKKSTPLQRYFVHKRMRSLKKKNKKCCCCNSSL